MWFSKAIFIFQGVLTLAYSARLVCFQQLRDGAFVYSASCIPVIQHVNCIYMYLLFFGFFFVLFFVFVRFVFFILLSGELTEILLT